MYALSVYLCDRLIRVNQSSSNLNGSLVLGRSLVFGRSQALARFGGFPNASNLVAFLLVRVPPSGLCANVCELGGLESFAGFAFVRLTLLAAALRVLFGVVLGLPRVVLRVLVGVVLVVLRVLVGVVPGLLCRWERSSTLLGTTVVDGLFLAVSVPC